MNSSNRSIKRIASSLCLATKNWKLLESGLETKLQDKTHSVNDYSSYKVFAFVNVKGHKTADANAVSVHCKNVPDFIQYIKEQRQVSEIYLKLGIDGGFLKKCLSLERALQQSAI